MVFCVQLRAHWATTQNRDRFLAEVDRGFQPNTAWGPQTKDNIPSRVTGNPGLVAERRYLQRADAQDLYDRLLAEWQTRTPTEGRLAFHVCSHDENPPVPCVEEQVVSV